MKNNKKLLLVLLSVGAVGLAGCGREAVTPSPTPTSTVDTSSTTTDSSQTNTSTTTSGSTSSSGGSSGASSSTGTTSSATTPVQKVEVSIAGPTEVASDGSITLTATVTGSSNTSVNWTSSDDTLVNISSSGVITVVKAIVTADTNVIITATSVADSSAKATHTVTVKATTGVSPINFGDENTIPADTMVYWADLGYIGSYVTVDYAAKVGDDYKFKYHKEQPEVDSAYGCAFQVFYKNTNLEGGKTYRLTFTLVSDVAGTIRVNDQEIEINAGSNDIDIDYIESANATGQGASSLRLIMGTNDGTPIDIDAAEFTISNLKWAVSQKLNQPVGVVVDKEGKVYWNAEVSPADVVMHAILKNGQGVTVDVVTVTNGGLIVPSKTLPAGTYNVYLQAVDSENERNNSIMSTEYGYYKVAGEVSTEKTDILFGSEQALPGDTYVYWNDMWSGEPVVNNSAYTENGVAYFDYTFPTGCPNTAYPYQVFYKNTDLIAGKKYTLTLKITINQAGAIRVNEQVFQLNAGENSISIEYTEKTLSSLAIIMGTNDANDTHFAGNVVFSVSDVEWNEVAAPTELNTPVGFNPTVSDTTVTIAWDGSSTADAAKTVAVFKQGDAEIKVVEVKNGDALTIADLGLAEGTYDIYLRSETADGSVKSAEVGAAVQLVITAASTDPTLKTPVGLVATYDAVSGYLTLAWDEGSTSDADVIYATIKFGNAVIQTIVVEKSGDHFLVSDLGLVNGTYDVYLHTEADEGTIKSQECKATNSIVIGDPSQPQIMEIPWGENNSTTLPPNLGVVYWNDQNWVGGGFVVVDEAYGTIDDNDEVKLHFSYNVPEENYTNYEFPFQVFMDAGLADGEEYTFKCIIESNQSGYIRINGEIVYLEVGENEINLTITGASGTKCDLEFVMGPASASNPETSEVMKGDIEITISGFSLSQGEEENQIPAPQDFFVEQEGDILNFGCDQEAVYDSSDVATWELMIAKDGNTVGSEWFDSLSDFTLSVEELLATYGSGNYEFSLRFETYNDGEFSPWSDPASLELRKEVPALTGLDVQYGGTNMTVYWDESSVAEDSVVIVEARHEGHIVGSVEISATGFVEYSDLNIDINYAATYTISATVMDVDGYLSESVEAAGDLTIAGTPVTSINKPTGFNATLSGSYLVLEWDEPVSGAAAVLVNVVKVVPDGEEAGAPAIRNWGIPNESGVQIFVEDELSNMGEGEYLVTIYFINGDVVSAVSDPVTITYTAPVELNQPLGFAANIEGDRIVFAWDGSTTTGATEYYVAIYVDGVNYAYIEDFGGNGGGVSLTEWYAGIGPGEYMLTLYTTNSKYTSEESAPATLVIPEKTSDYTAPVGLVVDVFDNNTKINFAWGPNPDGAVSFYVTVYLDGQALGGLSIDTNGQAITLQEWHEQFGSGATYQITIKTIGADGESPESDPVTKDIPAYVSGDTEGPGGALNTPAGFVATISPDKSYITFAWNGSTTEDATIYNIIVKKDGDYYDEFTIEYNGYAPTIDSLGLTEDGTYTFYLFTQNSEGITSAEVASPTEYVVGAGPEVTELPAPVGFVINTSADSIFYVFAWAPESTAQAERIIVTIYNESGTEVGTLVIDALNNLIRISDWISTYGTGTFKVTLHSENGDVVSPAAEVTHVVTDASAE